MFVCDLSNLLRDRAKSGGSTMCYMKQETNLKTSDHPPSILRRAVLNDGFAPVVSTSKRFPSIEKTMDELLESEQFQAI